MKFIFVDAENIGLKEVELINTAISDKVLVFSKNEAIKQVCEKNLFISISSYPIGNNQADFYIISSLASIVNSLKIEQKNSCEFILHSHDESLVAAFSFQCKLHKLKHRIAVSSKPPKNTSKTAQEKQLDQEILKLLKTPRESESLREELNVPKPDFTRAMNSLIKSNQIQRSEQKRKWIKTCQIPLVATAT